MEHNSNENNSNAGTEMPPVITWDPLYDCYRVNGVLFPKPLNAIPLEQSPPPSPPPPQQPPMPKDQQEQLGESSERTPRKKRDLTASRVVETKHFSLALLKCEQEQEFILGMCEIATGSTTTYYRLIPYQKSGRTKMEAKEVPLGTRTVSPVAEEVYPNTNWKYKLSMNERLEGRWTLEVRERLGTTKTEKFYFHQKVNKTFRSFNDVATFIIYGVVN